MESLVEKLKNTLKENNILIFGAGETSRRLLYFLSEEEKKGIVAFLDNDLNKVGNLLHEIPIYSISELDNLKFKFGVKHIVVCVQKKQDGDKICDQIKKHDPHISVIKCYHETLNWTSTIDEIIGHIRSSKKFPIMIYQMGKVGSSSIHRSLLNLGYDCWHEHFLSKKVFSYQFEKSMNFNNFIDFLKIHVDVDFPLYCISLVRDPIARNMSSFFQNIRIFFPTLIPNYRAGLAVIADFVDCFFHRYERWRHDIPLTWWHDELGRMFGIDVFIRPFDKEKGYEIYDFGPVKLLLMKCEMIKERAQEAFFKFLGIKNFCVVDRNITENKEYGDIYRIFKKSIVFSKSYIDRYLESPIYQHFYTEKEIQQMKDQYSISGG